MSEHAKEKDYAKIARAVAYGALLVGGLKLQVTNATGTVPATDASVSTTAKLDAILTGLVENFKALPYFGLVNEAATFVGEVIARSTTPDPALIEMMSMGQQQPQTPDIQPDRVRDGRTMTVQEPEWPASGFSANGERVGGP